MMFYSKHPIHILCNKVWTQILKELKGKELITIERHYLQPLLVKEKARKENSSKPFKRLYKILLATIKFYLKLNLQIKREIIESKEDQLLKMRNTMLNKL
jgi:hypothetical protein